MTLLSSVTVGQSPADKALEPVLADVKEAARRNADVDYGELYCFARELEKLGQTSLAAAIRDGIDKRRREFEAAQAEIETARAAEAGTQQENHPTTDEGWEEGLQRLAVECETRSLGFAWESPERVEWENRAHVIRKRLKRHQDLQHNAESVWVGRHLDFQGGGERFEWSEVENPVSFTPAPAHDFTEEEIAEVREFARYIGWSYPLVVNHYEVMAGAACSLKMRSDFDDLARCARHLANQESGE